MPNAWPDRLLLYLYPPPNVVGRGVYWIHRVRPSVVRVRVCGRNGFRTFPQKIQNEYVFWVKEETHEGNFQNFKIYNFERIFT